jgi:uncharacterized protein with HEPN domain
MPSTLSERDQRWLADIRKNIRIVEDIIARTDRKRFGEDVTLRYAVTYALQSISEAARRLSPGLKRSHRSIKWRDIEDAGNAYRHEYHRIDVDMLWQTAAVELAALKKALG